MMSIIMMVIFIFPLCLLKKMNWMVQNMLFFMSFMFIIMNFYSNYFVNISYFLGCDLISYGLIMLSFWIISLMLLSSEKIFSTNNYGCLFMLNILLLLLLLILTFMSLNLFSFYLFFESSLIPTLFLILGWGYQSERLQAGVYLLFYTLLVSLPMLLGIFYIYMLLGSLSFHMLNNIMFEYELLYFCLMMAFLVKMPMFLLHLWLPKAHVEAPVAGSMILAGIMLKLGGYGLLRVLPLFLKLGMKFNYLWITISLMGGLLVSLVCLCQVDLKALVAYSSVVHMGIVLSGMMTLSYVGICGSYTLMIAHGLSSSGLFCLVNIIYERTGSRSLLINKGLLNIMPSMGLWWFLLCISNMAAPPTLNLLGEVSLINSIVSWSWLTMLMLGGLSFFSAVYTLYLYTYSQHGKMFLGVYSFSSGNIREFHLLLLHWLPLNLLILKGECCLLWL